MIDANFLYDFQAQLAEKSQNKTADEALDQLMQIIRRKLSVNGELMACEQCAQIIQSELAGEGKVAGGVPKEVAQIADEAMDDIVRLAEDRINQARMDMNYWSENE